MMTTWCWSGSIGTRWGSYLLELPAGLLDVEGEPALDAARRELFEEAALAAENWHVLLDLYPSPGISDEAIRVYLARGLAAVADGRAVRARGRGDHADGVTRTAGRRRRTGAEWPADECQRGRRRAGRLHCERARVASAPRSRRAVAGPSGTLTHSHGDRRRSPDRPRSVRRAASAPSRRRSSITWPLSAARPRTRCCPIGVTSIATSTISHLRRHRLDRCRQPRTRSADFSPTCARAMPSTCAAVGNVGGARGHRRARPASLRACENGWSTPTSRTRSGRRHRPRGCRRRSPSSRWRADRGGRHRADPAGRARPRPARVAVRHRRAHLRGRRPGRRRYRPRRTHGAAVGQGRQAAPRAARQLRREGR